MSYGRHRRPRWHDRPRAWLHAALDKVCGREWVEDDAELTDDHGNHIGGDLPPVRYGHPVPERVVPAVPTSNGDWAGLKGTIGWDQHTAYNPAWAPCQFRPDVPRPVIRSADGVGLGPGYRQNVPRPRGARRWPASEATMPVLPPATEARWPSTVNDLSGSHRPGHLTMFDLVHVRSPWTPRPDDTIIQSGPRIRPELRIALLAGAW